MSASDGDLYCLKNRVCGTQNMSAINFWVEYDALWGCIFEVVACQRFGHDIAFLKRQIGSS